MRAVSSHPPADGQQVPLGRVATRSWWYSGQCFLEAPLGCDKVTGEGPGLSEHFSTESTGRPCYLGTEESACPQSIPSLTVSVSAGC